MTMCYQTTPEMQQMCPAVVHVDGTARPQVVDEQDGVYFLVLAEYFKLSGVHTLVNTSFNSHEEPIVCCPQDALYSFKSGSCDILGIYPFIIQSSVHKREQLTGHTDSGSMGEEDKVRNDLERVKKNNSAKDEEIAKLKKLARKYELSG